MTSATKQFIPMYDLESLTEDQRRQHYINSCERHGIPPELNLLSYFYMDSGDGKRNLTLYAKKGATDIIREKLNISTVSLTQASGPGYVAWIVIGKDKNERIEQAVGSASIEGLSGKALATAVMVAQTRATRRMTLQFAGGGLLDESELTETTTDINRTNMNLASMATLPATLPAPAQPAVSINVEAGRDVTVPFTGGDITPVAVETVEDVQQPAPVKKRRKRTNVIEMDSAGSSATVSQPESVKIVEVAPVVIETPALQPVVVPPPAIQPIQTTIFPSLMATPELIIPDRPTEPELIAWRGLMTQKFAGKSGALTLGGMQGNITKQVRRYATILFPDAPVIKESLILTNGQWRMLMDGMDEIVKTAGPAGLVKAIQDTLAGVPA